MMNYNAILVAALTLLQQETSEQLVGALPKHRAKEPFAEHIPPILDMYVHNLLSMKRFHGVLAGNVHECSL
jgi:hypothetical protein